MLKIGAAFLGFLLAAAVLGIAFWAWMRDEERGRGAPPPRRRTEQEVRCPICGNVYTAIPQDGVTVCPVCESYNDARASTRSRET
jgi:rubrerythrin